MYMHRAMIVDKAEPSEALQDTTVWSAGITPDRYLLSSRQLDQFRLGQALTTEIDMRAEPGSYFIESHLNLTQGETKEWYLVSEIEQDHAEVIRLIDQLSSSDQLLTDLKADLAASTTALRHLVGMADGIQKSG